MGAEVYTDMLLKNTTPYITTNVSFESFWKAFLFISRALTPLIGNGPGPMEFGKLAAFLLYEIRMENKKTKQFFFFL